MIQQTTKRAVYRFVAFLARVSCHLYAIVSTSWVCWTGRSSAGIEPSPAGPDDVQGIKGGLSGVCVLSGQLFMADSSIHDCTYGVEVQEDGHAFLERTSISFCTEHALVCEGHAMLKRCQVFANLSAWAKGGPFQTHSPGAYAAVSPSVAARRCRSHPEPGNQHVQLPLL
jgi:hypothetical protein